MSNPSPIDTAFRAVVMLGVLGGGGWAVATHTPLVDVAARQWDQWQHPPQTHPQDYADDAPAFQSRAATPAEPNGAPQTPQGQAMLPAPPGMLPAAGRVEPIRPAAPPAAVDLRAQSASAGAYPAQQIDFEPAAPSAATNSGGLVQRATDSLADLDAELGRLGAVYTVLEHWGQDSAKYRFHCRVALAAGTGETRRFEVVGDDPLRLMHQVIDQITAWRAGRTP